MARTYAKLLTRIWHNKDFLALSGSQQRLFMVAISQDTLNCCGVTSYSLARLARLSKDSTPKAIGRDLRALQHRWLLADPDTEEVWVVPFLKWDGVLEAPNSVRTMSNDFVTIHSDLIRERIVDWFKHEYLDGFVHHLVERFPKGFTDDKPYGINHGFLDAIGEPMGDGSGTRVCAQPKSHSQVPTPQPKAEVLSPASDAAEGDRLLRNGTGTNQLARRLAAACKPNNAQVAEAEAVAVLAWCLQDVGMQVIDEAIGWAESKRHTDDPCRLPRAIAKLIHDKATQAGIPLLPYEPSIGMRAMV